MEASSAGEASTPSIQRLSLLDLPPENLSNIVSYIPRKSLFPLLVVSKHFHKLASAALYRQLNFNLAQTDIATTPRDPAYRLPDALHTFLTSNYDYAQHIKSFTLRMVETDLDHLQKRIAAKFLAKEEAGQLLNTALLVMVKRAKALETFNWQVPIECSNLVYQALASNTSLQTLHIHLDIQSVAKHHYTLPPPPPPPGGGFGAQAGGWWDPMTGSSAPSAINSTTGSSKSSRSATPSRAQNRKLGAIKGLHSLTVTCIDDLATLDEIASCLQGSSKSLRTLTLSFAETLVSKSQKPSANNPHNLIPVQDDDVTTEPNSPELGATGAAPTDLDLKREKQAQEQALSRIFGLEKPSIATEKQDKKVERSLKRASKTVKTDKSNNVGKLANRFLDVVTKDTSIDAKTKKKLQQILGNLPKTHPGNTMSHKLHSAYAAAKSPKSKFPPNDDQYLADWDYKPPKPADFSYPTPSNLPPLPSWDSNGMPLPIDPPKTSDTFFPASSSSQFTVSEPSSNMPQASQFFIGGGHHKPSSQAILPDPTFASSHNKKKKATQPPITPSDSDSESGSDSDSGSDSESSTVQPLPSQPVVVVDMPPTDGHESDFDMDHPDVIESDEEDDADAAEDDPNVVTTADEIPNENDAQESEDKGKGKAKAQATQTKWPDHLPTLPNGVSHLDLAESLMVEKMLAEPVKTLTVEETIQEYVRMTHGLSIEELTLCFIPLKSSVLAKALDLRSLKRLVLYNVGAQGAFWTMVEKLFDQGTAFNLQTLYTDDVSPAFISCLGKLPGLKALHLLRRSTKEFSLTSNKPAPPLADIHSIGLKKHFETLQSLSITNLEDDTWDFDDRIIRALSNKAKKLKELAFAVDSNSFHTFLRCLPGLRGLVALHFINIKVSGAPSLMPHNEWKRLILDVLCYCPSLRLKYVGIALITNGRVSQIGNKPIVGLNEWYKKSASRAAAASKDATKDLSKDSDDEPERPNAVYAKTYRTGALADTYSIFSPLVLRGRL